MKLNIIQMARIKNFIATRRSPYYSLDRTSNFDIDLLIRYIQELEEEILDLKIGADQNSEFANPG